MQEEVRVQEIGYCPQAGGGHQTLTDSESPSSVLPHCTAGRAGHALGEIEEVRQTKEKKKKIEKFRSKGKKMDRDTVIAKLVVCI